MVADREIRPGLRQLLQRPSYRRFWAARTISRGGDVAQFTALALLVFHLTRSGLGVSAAVLAEIAPVLLLAPLAGPLVDRLPRLTVMITADVVRLVLGSVLALWHSDVGVVYALAFGLSAGSVFFNPAAASLLPALVSPEETVAANTGIWSAAVLSQVALAPLAGLLVLTAGFGWAFAANAASFAASAWLLRRLPGGERRPTTAPASLWSQGRESLLLLGRDRLLRRLALAQGLAALSAGATSALLVVLATRRLHVSGAGFGLMLAAIGAGAFLGPLGLSHIPARVSRSRLVFTAFGLRGLVDLSLALVTGLPAALAALTAYGVGTSAGSVTFTSLLQHHVPDEHRGRIFSAFDLLWQGMRLVSLLLGGVLADTVGIRAVYATGGLLLITAAATGLAAPD